MKIGIGHGFWKAAMRITPCLGGHPGVILAARRTEMPLGIPAATNAPTATYVTPVAVPTATYVRSASFRAGRQKADISCIL